jgi:hypothetical protein
MSNKSANQAGRDIAATKMFLLIVLVLFVCKSLVLISSHAAVLWVKSCSPCWLPGNAGRLCMAAPLDFFLGITAPSFCSVPMWASLCDIYGFCILHSDVICGLAFGSCLNASIICLTITKHVSVCRGRALYLSISYCYLVTKCNYLKWPGSHVHIGRTPRLV